LQERGLDDVVRVALDVHDLADEETLRVRRADPARELDAALGIVMTKLRTNRSSISP
jgi:hypothetical protein